MSKKLTPLKTIALVILIFSGCADDSTTDTNGSDGTDTGIVRQIAGTSALGRAGSWSNNCLGEACARADNDGNYLLATSVDANALMWTDIPEADGSNVRLYSRYRFDDAITTSLVNINPSTDAILDLWSQASQSQSIDLCANDPACASALMASFTVDVEQTLINQLDEFVGEAWPAGRNPFDDIYIASTTDALDLMHDHLQFVVTDSLFTIYDNDGNELAQTSLRNLTRDVNLNGSGLTLNQFNEARAIAPVIPSQNSINLAITVDPSQPTLAPTEVTVDASRSSSPTSDLTFTHELTLTDGTTTTFPGAIVTTTINTSGNQIWVVTAADASGHTRTAGYVIQLLSGDNEEPVFGGEGSCITPSSAMTANMQNICEEAQNGSTLGQCDISNSSSVVLVESPAPCAHQEQNDGLLLGVCTILVNEIRLFQYENPLRPNNIETFAQQQARVNNQCVDILGGTWSATP